MPENQMSTPTLDRHHSHTQVGFEKDPLEKELDGWYVQCVATDGDIYDRIGPYDTEDLANHIRNMLEL